MADNAHHTESLEVHVGESEEHHEKDLMAPEAQMVLFTWILFFVVLAILKKFAWKPILAKLDEREKHIEEGLQSADQSKEELANIEQKCKDILDQAENEAKIILAESKEAANQAASVIKKQAKEESSILIENAMREINEEKSKAQAFLKQETADISISLAGKLIHQNLDDDKNRQLINQLLQDI